MATLQFDNEEDNPSLEDQLEQQNAGGDGGEDNSEKILGKFDTQEELVNAYQELEKKLGSSSADDDDNTDDDSNSDDNDDDTDNNDDDNNDLEDKARSAVEEAGVDFDELRSHYDENGELSEEDYEKLEKGGIPRYLVDEFIEGQQARIEALETKVMNEVGGRESYEALTGWAASNLSQSEIDAFNEQVGTGDEGKISLAVSALQTKYEKATGKEPSTRVSGGNDGAVVGTYENWNQVQADMSKPEYKNDPAFREKVQKKLASSFNN